MRVVIAVLSEFNNENIHSREIQIIRNMYAITNACVHYPSAISIAIVVHIVTRSKWSKAQREILEYVYWLAFALNSCEYISLDAFQGG